MALALNRYTFRGIKVHQGPGSHNSPTTTTLPTGSSLQSIVLPNGQSQHVVKNFIFFLNKRTLERSKKNGGKGDLPVAWIVVSGRIERNDLRWRSVKKSRVWQKYRRRHFAFQERILDYIRLLIERPRPLTWNEFMQQWKVRHDKLTTSNDEICELFFKIFELTVILLNWKKANSLLIKWPI